MSEQKPSEIATSGEHSASDSQSRASTGRSTKASSSHGWAAVVVSVVDAIGRFFDILGKPIVPVAGKIVLGCIEVSKVIGLALASRPDAIKAIQDIGIGREIAAFATNTWWWILALVLSVGGNIVFYYVITQQRERIRELSERTTDAFEAQHDPNRLSTRKSGQKELWK